MTKLLSRSLPVLLCIWLFTHNAHSATGSEKDTGTPKFSYYTIEPDIVTNYMTEGRKLGFIDVQVDLMVDSASLLPLVEYHQPMIRDIIIQVLTQENKERITSLSGRETIRKTCLEKVNDMLLSETGKKVLSDLLFTKYLYQ